MVTYSVNKRARFDYEILETLEAGLVLSGPEVKSIRLKRARLTGGFITFHNGRAYATNLHIPAYRYSSDQRTGYDPEKSREVLLKKKECLYLQGKTQEQGLTIIPLSLYASRSRIKLEIAVARGKKKYDKRESIRERESRRETMRKMKETR